MDVQKEEMQEIGNIKMLSVYDFHGHHKLGYIIRECSVYKLEKPLSSYSL